MIRMDTMREIIEAAESKGQKISEIVLEQTAIDTEQSIESVKQTMLESYEVMKQSIQSGVKEDVKSGSGLTGGMAFKMKSFCESEKCISGSFIGEILTNALAVSEHNACMGRIVAAPTAGSCGILPACLVALQNKFGFSDEQIVMGMINASAVGVVIAKNASISGAEGGCQAECGSAAAMAASAMTELMGGSPSACGHAVAQVIKSLLGLVCDPVAGLVEEPCVVRNASSAAIAVAATEMSLAGIESIIPVDEVIHAMRRVGRAIPPSLRETSEGGLAVTETGKAIKAKLLGNK